MKNKIRKIGLIVILILIIMAIVFVAVNSSTGKKEQKIANKDNGRLTTIQNIVNENNVSDENIITENEVNNEEINSLQDNSIAMDNSVSSDTEKKKATVTELKDGTKYSVDDSITKADMIIGDNYFGTQIADITLNFEKYAGKTIEIEGLYFENGPYTFVGRYSTSAVCPTCPVGYSYFEYEWHGDKEISLEDSKDWIKVIGTLKEGNDETGPYYYIDVASIEVMKSQGIITVSN